MSDDAPDDLHPPDEELWLVDDVAQYLKINPKFLDKLEDEEGLPVHRLSAARTRRYFPSEVKAWLRNRCSSVPSQVGQGAA